MSERLRSIRKQIEDLTQSLENLRNEEKAIIKEEQENCPHTFIARKHGHTTSLMGIGMIHEAYDLCLVCGDKYTYNYRENKAQMPRIPFGGKANYFCWTYLIE